jgi:hypothetical protein
MNDAPNYPSLKLPEAPQPQTAVERSVSRDDAFSKPGHMGKAHATKGARSHKTWSPAKGVRFRPTNERVPGRRRKLARDERSVTFY